MKTRLFIGGLDRSTIQDSDVVKLFSSFGTVEDFVRIPNKYYSSGSVHKDVYERSFAYVSLDVEEEKHAKRAVGALNGTKWNGCSLRCQFAKPSGIEKVMDEIKTCEHEKKEEDVRSNEKGGMKIAEAPLRLRFLVSSFPSSDGCILSVPVVKGDLSHDNPQKTYFENDDGCCLVVDSEKKWDAIDTPRQVYNFERHLQELQAGVQRPECSTGSSSGDGVQEQITISNGVSSEQQQSKKKEGARALHKGSKRSKVDDDASKVAATAVENILKRQRIGIIQSLNPQLKTVNFFTEEDDVGKKVESRSIDLSRFDSDSDDDAEHIPQVDGAMDSSDGSISRSSTSHDSSATESSSSSHDDTDVNNDDGSAENEEENVLQSSKANHPDDVNDEDQELEHELSILYKIFPNAANFKRRDPIEHIEATWRAEKDSLLKELKEMKRQALRAQGEKKKSGRKMA
jgi:RNA recognition motif-containing protein